MKRTQAHGGEAAGGRCWPSCTAGCLAVAAVVAALLLAAAGRLAAVRAALSQSAVTLSPVNVEGRCCRWSVQRPRWRRLLAGSFGLEHGDATPLGTALNRVLEAAHE